MKQEEARIECLRFWEYMVKHPEVASKKEHPLFSEFVTKYIEACPLCDIFKIIGKECIGCPLKSPDFMCMYYNRWSTSVTDKERKYCAEIIVNKVKKWNTKGLFKTLFNFLFQKRLKEKL